VEVPADFKPLFSATLPH